MNRSRRVQGVVWLFVLLLLPPALPAADIQVHVLFAGGAVLTIDGQRQRLAVGETSPEGVHLLAADPQGARVEVGGRVRDLTLADARFGGQYQEPVARAERVFPDARGAYRARGSINGHPTTFLVDTGATLVTLSEDSVTALGLRLDDGEPLRVETAQGETLGREVRLGSVRLGGIERSAVRAVVLPGAFPRTPLLGMSFLGQVGLRTEAGVLVLDPLAR